jgi:hypothetical protein
MYIKYFIILTSFLAITAREIDPQKLLDRLNNSNPLMFENFAFDQLNWKQCMKDVQEIVATESNARFVAFNLLRSIEDALNELDEFQKKLELIGENLRHHKFKDFDRRNGSEVKKNISIYSFPVPELDSIKFDIADYCLISLESCVNRTYEAFRYFIKLRMIESLN